MILLVSGKEWYLGKENSLIIGKQRKKIMSKQEKVDWPEDKSLFKSLCDARESDGERL